MQQTINHKREILTDHGIKTMVQGDTLLAYGVVIGPDGSDASEWCDVTSYTDRAIYRWLGY